MAFSTPQHQSAVGTDTNLARRAFLCQSGVGFGSAALHSLISGDHCHAQTANDAELKKFQLPGAPRAKRIIYLFMHGGPSQMDLLDYKPALEDRRGMEIPKSVLGNQRLTGMVSGQATLPVAPSVFKFQQHGKCGLWASELLPNLAAVSDDLCVIKSMHTEAINHDPAVTFMQTGFQQPGRASLGSWLSYGIGSENANLPAFVVLISQGSAARPGDPLYARLWGSGPLPSKHQGVQFRSSGDPVLYLSNPDGVDAGSRRRMLDALKQLNESDFIRTNDAEIQARIAQYEMAFRMQTSVPELTDMSDESQHTLDLYGPDVNVPGSFAANCLLARRMAERGVRSIQLYHRGWDQHYDLPSDLRLQCQDVDRPCAALLNDLKQRGMLDDTLVVWGGEFGRSIYSQGTLTASNYGRDHHPRCFAMWVAGGGIKGGMTYGETDEFSYNVIENGVSVFDLNATMLHCLGIDHRYLTYHYQGLDQRLTGVEPANVVHDILA